MTTRSCTLSFSRLRDAMFAEIRKIPKNSGIWCDSLNHHTYAQHTLWHITATLVTVFHFNLMKNQASANPIQHENELNTLRALSAPYLTELGIVVTVTLQDGAQKLMENAALPLLHFTYQSLNLLRSMDMQKWTDDSLVLVFDGEIFIECFKHTSNLKDMYKRLTAPFHNLNRQAYRFEEELLSVENSTELVAKISRVIELTTRPAHNETAQITTQYLAGLRGLWQRTSNVAVTESSADVARHFETVSNKINGGPLPSNVPPNTHILKSLAVYAKLLKQNPEIPSECFNFAFDYELTMTHRTIRNPNTQIFHILERYSSGKI